MNVSLERIGLDNTSVPVDNQKMAGGKFGFALKEVPKPGLYRIKMGQSQLIFVLDGTEKKVEFSGTLADVNQGKYELKGAPAAEGVVNSLKDLMTGQVTIEMAQKKIDEAGTRDLHVGHAVGLGERGDDALGQLAGLAVRGFRQHQGDGAGEITVSSVASALQRDIGRRIARQ